MKIRYTSMFGLLVVAMLVASFVVPMNLTSRATVEADPGVMRWTTVDTPGRLAGGKGDITNDMGIRGSAIHDLAVAPDGITMLASIRDNLQPFSAFAPAFPTNIIRASSFMGIDWTTSSMNALQRAPGMLPGRQVYNVAIAPDDSKFWAVVTDNVTGVAGIGPREVWISTTGGATWQLTGLEPFLDVIAGAGNEFVRDIDISPDYGGRRDIAVATGTLAGGTANGDIYVLRSNGFGGWLAQNITAAQMGVAYAANIDYYAIKFSPTYAGDSSLAFVCATDAGAPAPFTNATIYNIALRDIDANTTVGLAFTIPGPEVRDPAWAQMSSPEVATLDKATLELPSDFSGTAVSLRRAYIATDSLLAGGAAKAATARDGIFRIDDTTVYTLMDTSQDAAKSIYSIAYFGTYASGKLLAGERLGYECTASVPTWFTDSPTTCPVPCWYPALKPTTGAAIAGACAVGAKTGVGAAIVAWNPAGTLALVVTGNQALQPNLGAGGWWAPWLAAPIPNEEGAFAISRNNGETWNQLGMINTTLDWLNDVAAAPDCSTVYLASSNNGAPMGCLSFDSVWRSSMNSAVTAPLPPMPIGTYWERVFTHVTATDCANWQSDLPILRLSPYCDDLPDGQLIAWAAQGTRAQAWSPDFGDYWAFITPRHPVWDFAFESSKVMYDLEAFIAAPPPGNPFPMGGGQLVQKLPFTGTAWSTLVPDVDAEIPGHTIVAYPEGKVLVGFDTTFAPAFVSAIISTNFATDAPSFDMLWALSGGTTNDGGNVHGAFDTNFKNNGLVYLADEAANIPMGWPKATATATVGSVYRNKVPGASPLVEMDMMEPSNGAIGTHNGTLPVFANEGLFGIVNAFTGANGQQALYVASDNVAGVLGGGNSVVFRTLWPQDGMPKPGIVWDALMIYAPITATNINFTLEPSSLKECGSCSIDTNTTLYVIDDEAGGQYLHIGNPAGYAPYGTGSLWTYTDCLAKKGPTLITEDKALIGCDPVSGRAQEVNLCWEQLCVAVGYDIEIGKAADFNIRVIDFIGVNNPAIAALVVPAAVGLVPANRLEPCAFIPAGGLIGVPGSVGTTASALAAWGNLECGHTYYWRVMARSSATGEVARSPWSDARSFTIKAGLPVTTPYYGPQLLAPNNGCLGCPTKPASFSWSPFKETMKYKFVLAKDAAMTQVVKEAEVPTTAFEYDGTLDNSTNYFWRVMSLEPAPSDWSATFSFQTEAPPAPAPTAPKTPPTPLWVWVVIAIGVILVVVTLVLIFKTRRT